MVRPEKSINSFITGLPVKIVALGDSLTAGWMVEKGYLDYLEEMLAVKYPKRDITIINRGVPGDTSEDGLIRLEDDVLVYEPNLVFVQFGLNDAYNGISPERYEKNISKIVKILKSKNESDILLLTSSLLDNSSDNEYMEKYYNILVKISNRSSIPVAMVHDYWKKMIKTGTDFTELLQEDMVHPTERGYKLFARAVMRILS